MTTPAPIPATEVPPRMPSPPDTAPNAPPAQPQAPAPAAAPTLRSQVVENPLLSFFGLMIVALLAASIAAPNIRINDTNQRIDRLDGRMMAGFAEVDAQFDEVDARFDEVDAQFDEVDARFDAVDARLDRLDLKLTALIAKLDADDEVNAAVEGLGGSGGSDAPTVTP